MESTQMLVYLVRLRAKCSLKWCHLPRKCSLLRLRFLETNTVKLTI